MNNWKNLDKDRVYKKHPNGFLIVKPKVYTSVVPFVCPVCNLFMRNDEDAMYYTKYVCCSCCAIKWAEGGNKEKWLNGWRPPKNELKEFRRYRQQLLSY